MVTEAFIGSVYCLIAPDVQASIYHLFVVSKRFANIVLSAGVHQQFFLDFFVNVSGSWQASVAWNVERSVWKI